MKNFNLLLFLLLKLELFHILNLNSKESMSATTGRQKYENPPLQIQLRGFFSKESRDFRTMIQLIHEEFSGDKDGIMKYCASCHIILTRAGRKLHENCEHVFSSSCIVGIILFFIWV